MLFVQLSSILLVGYFVTAHCILTPIFSNTTIQFTDGPMYCIK